MFIHKGQIMTIILHCFIPYEDVLMDLQQIVTLCENRGIVQKKILFQIWLCSTIDFVKTIKQWVGKKYHFYTCVWNLEQIFRTSF
jgi:hypothetical protein